MRVLCAPDSFKESLSAVEVARAMARGVVAAGAEADICPIADGGEGTLDALVTAMGARVETVPVVGPLGEAREARLGLWDVAAPSFDARWVGPDQRVGIVELAEAAGLALVDPDERDPTRTSTYGVGLLILAALARGCDRIIVGVGGSATCDGGAGIAQAMGASFYDRAGRRVEARLTGGHLLDVARVEPPLGLPVDQIHVACDVTNPLFGPNGAAAVYGPQKGATPEQVALLDAGLRHFASVVGGDPWAPGAGAAGGAAFGLAALCGATLERGVDLVLAAVRFDERCRRADLVLTGEGRLDAQTLNGKAVTGVATAAYRLGVPTVAIVGATGPGAADCTNPSRGGFLRGVFSLAERFGSAAAMERPFNLTAELSREIVSRSSYAPPGAGAPQRTS